MIITLYVDAVFGVKVKRGDRVKEGDELGMTPSRAKPLVSPFPGTVHSISFNSQDHTFEIKIKIDSAAKKC